MVPLADWDLRTGRRQAVFDSQEELRSVVAMGAYLHVPSWCRSSMDLCAGAQAKGRDSIEMDRRVTGHWPTLVKDRADQSVTGVITATGRNGRSE